MSPDLPRQFSFRAVLGRLVAVCAAVYATGVVALQIVLDLLGAGTRELEAHLAFVAAVGMFLMHEDGLVLGLVLLVTLGIAFVRWRRRGLRAGPDTVFALLMLLLPLSAAYAWFEAMRQEGVHARRLQAAVATGDRQRVREAVFACEFFCGFRRDSGPLVWLVRQAAEDADFNAIGRILTRGGERDAPSRWLPDGRTALQVAVERYPQDWQLTLYVLGIDSGRRAIQVPPASPEEYRAAAAHAQRAGAPQALLQRLAPYASLPP